MPDAPITTFNALQPSIVRTIREAFDDALKMVDERRGPNAPPSTDDTRAMLAKAIVNMAKHGICDAARLRDEALKALRLLP